MLATHLFVWMVVTHFAADWLTQTDWVATQKSKNTSLREGHVWVYTIAFWVLFLLCGVSPGLDTIIALVWIGISHYILDSYYPVYLWARYVRRPTVLTEAKNPEEGMKAWVATPIGLILAIAVDQIFHILSLVPVAIFLGRDSYACF